MCLSRINAFEKVMQTVRVHMSDGKIALIIFAPSDRVAC